MEHKQRQIHDNELLDPILVIKKVATLNFKKENPISQLQPKMKILISYYLESLVDFGIKSTPYKIQNSSVLANGNSQPLDDTEGTYFYTSDLYDSK